MGAVGAGCRLWGVVLVLVCPLWWWRLVCPLSFGRDLYVHSGRDLYVHSGRDLYVLSVAVVICMSTELWW